jgi:anti-sigma factor RsiW
MNEHEAVRNLLALAVSGALDPHEQLRVERHIHECAACREEMETWTVFAGGLGNMPQPAVPEYLAERTQQKVLWEREVRAERRRTGLILAALSLFGWSVSLALWLLLRVSMGDSMVILQVDLLRPDLWALLGTLLVWASGATAAVVLARSRQEWRTAL